jgi:hypothetical protein
VSIEAEARKLVFNPGQRHEEISRKRLCRNLVGIGAARAVDDRILVVETIRVAEHMVTKSCSSDARRRGVYGAGLRALDGSYG